MENQLQPVELPPGLKWIVIFMVLTIVVGILALTVGPMMVRDWRELKLKENGTDATAIILRIQDTGDRHNEDPIVQFSVEMRPEDMKAYRASITTTMSAVELPKYKEGDRVRVRYDREKPERVVLIGPIPNPPAQ